MARQLPPISQQVGDLTRKLHRQEIQLARLKAKQKRAAQSNERLKIRLGNLFYQVNPQILDSAELQQKIVELAAQLSSSHNQEHYRQSGDDWIRSRGKSEKPGEAKRAKSTSDEHQMQLDQKIKTGELMLRCQLHHYSRLTLLGAILALHVN